MARNSAGKPTTLSRQAPERWRLQDAKERFSELVRRAHSDGPQHVTLHGRDAVVVIDALQASPHRDIEFEPDRSVMPVRDVTL